jgi:type IV secretion system protein TrbL
VQDLGVIDRFMQAFIRYIDSGFGLLGGDVGFLTTTLIGIDITLAGLFWAMGGEDNVLGRLIKKILYVGVFAFILNSFSTLADIIFKSFAQAGLTAGGGTLSADDLLGLVRPRRHRLFGGLAAARPGLEHDGVHQLLRELHHHHGAALLLGDRHPRLLHPRRADVRHDHRVQADQLAGFILVPFALWNRTSFLAERVLGNVVSSGIKVMVLAVIVGIGSNFFSEFVSSMQGQEPDLGAAMSLALGALSLFGLGIFGPGIASGLVSGAPQLGAGAAFGTAVGAAGVTMLAGGATMGAARALGGGALGAIRAGTSMGSAASTAAQLGKETGGSAMGGIASAAKGAAAQKMESTFGLGAAAERGRNAAWSALNRSPASSSAGAGGSETSDGAPAWARSMRAQQSARHHRQIAVHTLQQGDRGGGSATPDIKEKE